MSIKCNNVVDTHTYQFLKCECAVERFSRGSAVLSAFIEHRHDESQSASFAADRADHTLDVHKMIVGAHRNLLTIHFVGYAIIENVRENISIMTAKRFVNDRLTFTGAEARAFRVYEIRIGLIVAPFVQIRIHLGKECVAAFHADDTQITEIRFFHVNKPSVCVVLFPIM